MPELKSYVCPNCGANTTNAHNCEYCGSLLVRFVEKKIDIDQQVFGAEAFIFEGLVNALKNNLLLQESSSSNQTVITEISDASNPDEGFQIFPTSSANAGIDAPNPFEGTGIGLALRLSFLVKSPDDNISSDAKRACRLFRDSNYYPLFVEQQWNYGINYYIDCGKDAESAAHIISDIIQNIYGWDQDVELNYNTMCAQKKDISVEVFDDTNVSFVTGCTGYILLIIAILLIGVVLIAIVG